MPDEPNKKMDEMLRAYAQERRKAPEVSLHPATRNMLQGEVNKVFGSSQAALPWWRRLRAFWPHFAFAGGLCLVFGIAVLSLRQPPPVMQESREQAPPGDPQTVAGLEPVDLANESKKREEIIDLQKSVDAQKETAISEIPAPVAEPRQLERRAEFSRKLKEGTFTQSSPPAEKPAHRLSENAPREQESVLLQSAPILADSAAAATTSERDASPRSRSISPTRSSVVVPNGKAPAKTEEKADAVKTTLDARGLAGAAAPKLAEGSHLTNLSAARRLSFVRFSDTPVAVGARLDTASIPPVLTSFQMEQVGTNLRVLDRDGSIYLGALAPTNNAVETLALKDQSDPISNSQAYFFKVQGTNRTLNSDVVLIGNYFEQTNPEPASLDAFAVAPEGGAQQQSQARQYIIGNATVGNTSQVPVRAISTSP